MAVNASLLIRVVDALVENLAVLEIVFHQFEGHTLEFAVLDDEFLRGVIDDDFDVFFLGVLQLPIRCLEELPRFARHHLDALRTEPQGRSATVHRRVADSDDQHGLAD